MLFKETIDLVAVKKVDDADHYQTSVETKRTVFANEASVKRAEFYEAMKAGTQVSLTLEMRGIDYDGEELLDYKGKRYRLTRPYTKNGEMVELNCKEEVI